MPARLSERVKARQARETISGETPDSETDRPADAIHGDILGVVRSGEAGLIRGGYPRWLLESGQGPTRGSFRFLPGNIRMLAGEARDIASDRAGFLGSHPEAGATRAPRKHQ